MNVIKKIVRIFLLILGRAFYFNKKSKIVYYHDVCDKVFYESPDTDILQGTPIRTFKEHVKVIKKKGYSIVPIITKAEQEVSIMFDDGYRGIWDNRQYFYDNNIKPTVFLAADLIGKPSFLNVEEILELQKHGFVFQCHSWSHIDLSGLTPEELKKELCDSKAYLSKILGKDVTEICLPIGFYSDTLLSELRKYNYKKIYSSVPGNNSQKVAGVMETRNFCQTATPLEFNLILSGGSEILRKHYESLHYQKK